MSDIPFKYSWRAFWWGFFHPFIGAVAQHNHAVELAKELAASKIKE